MARTKQRQRNNNKQIKKLPILPQAPEGFSMIEVMKYEHICHCKAKFETRQDHGTHHKVDHNQQLAKCGLCKMSFSKYRFRATLDPSGDVIEVYQNIDAIAYPNPRDCNLHYRDYFCPCRRTFAGLEALRKHQERQHGCTLLYQDYLDIFKKWRRFKKRQKYAKYQQHQESFQENNGQLRSETQQKKEPENLNETPQTENHASTSETSGGAEKEDSSTIISEGETLNGETVNIKEEDDETRAIESEELGNKKSHRDLKRDHSQIDDGYRAIAIKERHDSLLEDGDGGYSSNVENISPPKKKRKKTTSKKQRKQSTKGQNIPQEDHVPRANTTPTPSSNTMSNVDGDHQRSVSKAYKPTERERFIVMHARAAATHSGISTSTNQKKLKDKYITGEKQSRKEYDATRKREVKLEEEDEEGNHSNQLEIDVDGDIFMGGVKKGGDKSLGIGEFEAGEDDGDIEGDNLEEECILLERKIAKKNKRIQKVEKAIAEEKAAYILKINELRGNIKQIAEIMSQQVSGDSDDELL